MDFFLDLEVCWRYSFGEAKTINQCSIICFYFVLNNLMLNMNNWFSFLFYICSVLVIRLKTITKPNEIKIWNSTHFPLRIFSLCIVLKKQKGVDGVFVSIWVCVLVRFYTVRVTNNHFCPVPNWFLFRFGSR